MPYLGFSWKADLVSSLNFEIAISELLDIVGKGGGGNLAMTCHFPIMTCYFPLIAPHTLAVS